MRAALETMFSGLFAIVFGVLWLQLFAAFWVPSGFTVLEAELRWIISVGSCAACMLLPLGVLLLMAGFLVCFARLIHTRVLRCCVADPPIPPARVARGLWRHRVMGVLSCVSGVGRARQL